MKKVGRKVLPAIRPNAGTEAIYRARLNAMIDQMHKSVGYHLRVAYNKNPPRVATLMAADELPTTTLGRALAALTKRWLKSFDDLAHNMAQYFATASEKRVTSTLNRHLQDSGLAVPFKMSRPMQDAVNASIAEQVGLIKSIPAEYLTSVQGDVMRMIQNGGDMTTLNSSLRKNYGATKRRAAIIARDQNNKSVATMTRTRMLEAGVKTALWVHSHGGKTPRPTHLANDGHEYDITTGWYDPAVDKYIHPGQEINCRCVTRPVVRGFM